MTDEDQHLQQCYEPSQNDTVFACPIINQKDSHDVTVVVHIPHQDYKDLLRILLPSSNYNALVWSKERQQFVEIKTDIVKQLHFDRKNQLFHDFMMFIDAAKFEIDNFVFIKLIKTVNEN